MTTRDWLQIVGGLLVLAGAWLSARYAGRASVQVAEIGADEGAFVRAQGIYDAALKAAETALANANRQLEEQRQTFERALHEGQERFEQQLAEQRAEFDRQLAEQRAQFEAEKRDLRRQITDLEAGRQV